MRIRSGETLGIVFAQLNLPATLMHRLLSETSASNALTHLREGQELAFELDAGGQLKTLRFDRDNKSRVDIKVAGSSITEAVQVREVERRVEIAAGEITSSLYADGARAGLTSGAINEMANIFKFDIDFVEDVRMATLSRWCTRNCGATASASAPATCSAPPSPIAANV